MGTEDRISIEEWKFKYRRGEFTDVAPDIDRTMAGGFYDWFCNDSALAARFEKLARFAMLLHTGPRVNLKTNQVIMKNCCPLGGPLYDMLQIVDRRTGNVKWAISFKCCHYPTGKFNRRTGSHSKAPYPAVVHRVPNDNEEPEYKGDEMGALAYLNGEGEVY